MVQKINSVVNLILNSLKHVDGLDSVQRIPFHSLESNSSPLYRLKLDLFFEREIPTVQERFQRFPPHDFMESSLTRNKDRFVLEDLPVHIDYKKTSDVDRTIDSAFSPPFILNQETTYGLFRVLHGITVFSTSSWIKNKKLQLEQIPAAFWSIHRSQLVARVEHLLADMAQARFHRDPLHFQISMAHYLESICELLFTINRTFLCPAEEMMLLIEKLEILPSGFSGLFGSLIREDPSLDQERRLEVARLLAEHIFALD